MLLSMKIDVGSSLAIILIDEIISMGLPRKTKLITIKPKEKHEMVCTMFLAPLSPFAANIFQFNTFDILGP